jgi:signal transduction histidine kinase
MRKLWTVRMRLTALYGGLFIITTTVFLVAMDLLLRRLLDQEVSAIKAKRQATHSVGLSFRGRIQDTGQPDPSTTASGLRSRVLAHQWAFTWVAVALLALIGAAAAWWLAGRVLRRLHWMTATARRLSLSTLHERIGLVGPQDELKELADTFDAMFERLEQAADNQRRFVANASHELRTPLAIQRVAIEIGLEDPSPEQLARVKQDMLQANQRTEQLIDGLLALAQGERRLTTQELVSLDHLVAEVVEQHRGQAEGAGIALDLQLERVDVSGDPALLSRLTANLVHNAICYNHPGGQIQIRTSPASGLTVANTGPTIAPEEVSGLLEPFRRLHSPGTDPGQGAGLGLSIVAAIAKAHNASLTTVAKPNGGLTVNVKLTAPTHTTPTMALTG